MNTIKSIRIILAFLFIFELSGGATVAVEAKDDGGVSVTLEAPQTDFAETEDVVVQVTISNPGSKPIKVLKWLTPAEDIEEPLFSINLEGEPVGYIGPEYKRPEVKGADYINLKPGEDLVRTVVISDFYDFSATGTYNLSYKVTSNQLYSEKGSGTLNNADSLVSNEIELKVAGRPAKDLPVSPDAVTGTTSYNKCTTTQQTSLVSARNQASLYSGGALSYLNANTQGPRYTTWFGVYDSARYSTVKTHFTAISSAMDTKPVTFDCGCKKNYYAYVYPTKPYVIYLCKVFWTAPLSGTDSKAGTLIHEMSHFNVVASTDDYVYGQTLAKNLAITDPTKAINNADNHEYFAENTPAQQ